MKKYMILIVLIFIFLIQYISFCHAGKMSNVLTSGGNFYVNYAWRMKLLEKGWGWALPDNLQNHVLAVNLIKHKKYTLNLYPPFNDTLWKEPGYPVFLAVLYKVHNKNYDYGVDYTGNMPRISFNDINIDFVGIYHILIFILGLFLFYLLLVKYILADLKHKTLLSCLIIVIFFLLVRNTFQAYYVVPGVYAVQYFLSLLIMYMYINAIEDSPDVKSWKFFLLGLIIGAATLFTSVYKYALILPVIISALLFIKRKFSSKKLLISVILMLAGYIIVVSPWLIRNYKVCGEFKFACRLGYMMYGKGMAASCGQEFHEPDAFLHPELKKLTYDEKFTLTDNQLDNYFMNKGKILINKYRVNFIKDCLFQLKHQLSYKPREIVFNLLIIIAFIISVARFYYKELFIFLFYGYFVSMFCLTSSFLGGHAVNVLYLKFICLVISIYLILKEISRMRFDKIIERDCRQMAIPSSGASL